MASVFMRRRNSNTDKRDWKGAVEDAVILFFITLTSNLTAYGYPPTLSALYSSILTALLTFFLAIQRRFKIEAPTSSPHQAERECEKEWQQKTPLKSQCT
jgi:hypothetical protein